MKSFIENRSFFNIGFAKPLPDIVRMEFTVEAAFTAIETMHSSFTDREAFQEAASWLAKFQESLQAWSICDSLVREARSRTSAYYAAQMLRNKVLKQFDELPPDSYEQFRNSLVAHLMAVDWLNPRDSVIVTQLSLALVDLYLQVPKWPYTIGKLIGEFVQHPVDRTGVILTLLKLFPEEAQNPQVDIGQNRRTEVEAELAGLNVEMIAYIGQVCVAYQGNNDVICKAIKCMATWILNDRIPTKQFADHPILASAISVLEFPEGVDFSLHEASTDLLCAAFQRIDRDITDRQDLTLAILLHSKVFCMIDKFDTAEEGQMRNYARLFTEAAEAFALSMLEEPGTEGFGNVQFLDLLLVLAAHPDMEYIDISFNFWYYFGAHFIESPDDPDEWEIYRPYIRRYMVELLKHCRYDPQDEFIDEDDDDEFAQFRARVCESANDIFLLIGVEECLKLIAEYFNRCEKTWVEIEAVVFFLSAFMDKVHPMESFFIPEILEAVISSGQDCHPLLSRSMIGLVKRAEEWIQRHPACLNTVMDWLIARLNDERFAAKAARAVLAFCIGSSSSLTMYFDLLYEVVAQYETNPELAGLVQSAGNELIEACANIAKNRPLEEFIVKFDRLVRRSNECLSHIVAKEKLSAEEFHRKEKCSTQWELLTLSPITWMNRLSCVYRYVEPYGWQYLTNSESPLALQVNALVEGTWKVLLDALETFASDLSICESCCRAMRFVIRSLGPRSAHLARELIQVMVRIYQVYPHSCFLYVGSIMVDEYSSQREFLPDLLMMVELLAQGSIGILKEWNGFLNNPDTVDDLFRIGVRFVQKAPAAFLATPVAHLFFQCGVQAVRVDHQDVISSVSLFFQETALVVSDRRQVCAGCATQEEMEVGIQKGRGLFEEYGAQLVHETINMCLYRVTMQNRTEVVRIFNCVKKVCPNKFNEFLARTFELLPHDTLKSATTEQLREFHLKMTSTDYSDTISMIHLVEDLCDYYR
uniref:Importin N-terminal domain-containing protein n=1 Tax=Steinernema glaseri TaxID=37863 RepID=A0A1I8A6K2_9BILA